MASWCNKLSFAPGMTTVTTATMTPTTSEADTFSSGSGGTCSLTLHSIAILRLLNSYLFLRRKNCEIFSVGF